MGDPLDISPIGLDPDGREQLVSSIMERVAMHPRQSEHGGLAWMDRVLAESMTWARPAAAFAATALVAGVAVLSSTARATAGAEVAGVRATPLEEWVRGDTQPTPTEVLINFAADGP